MSGEKTPVEVLADIRNDLRELKNKELSARMKLPKEDWQRDYDRRKHRTLRGTKEVEVDFEIDAEDLEYLGYHHQKDCTVRQYDEDGDLLIEAGHEDDRRALLDWHDHNHGLTLWANCPHEPCHLLSDAFRSTP